MREKSTSILTLLFIFCFFGLAQSQNISSQMAQNRGVNPLASLGETIFLQNPLHNAAFNEDGFLIQPKSNGPDWQWQLNGISQGNKSLILENDCQEPTQVGHIIQYNHTILRELYIPKIRSIEQQFVLDHPLGSSEEDLLIEGAILCDGEFMLGENNWIWANSEGKVSLGDVTVYDAKGNKITAEMEVGSNYTRIRVDGTELAHAQYPVTIDPEVGTDDMRITHHGSDGGGEDAVTPDVAYNATDNEYLVVYSGDSTQGEEEIWGQFVDGSNGALIGNIFPISNLGTPGNTLSDCYDPSVVWNETDNQYLVVWEADNDTGLFVNGEMEIYGQFLSAAGAEIGINDFRISFQGPDGDPAHDAVDPELAWNSDRNEYLVVWPGDTLPGEDEIFGQRISSAGTLLGSNFRISHQGPDGSTSYDAFYPDVVYNSIEKEYMLVWFGDSAISEEEIWGQRLDSLAKHIGSVFQISNQGTPGSTSIDATTPNIVWNSDDNEYLVVWRGDNDSGMVVDNEFEIWGQMLDGQANPIGVSGFRISDLAGSGNDGFDCFDPHVAYSSACHEYLVVWEGEDSIGQVHVNGEFDIHLQRIAADGSHIGSDSIISDMGPVGDANYDARQPRVIFNSTNLEFFIVWDGDDTTGTAINNEFEIWGQRWSCEMVCAPPVITCQADTSITPTTLVCEVAVNFQPSVLSACGASIVCSPASGSLFSAGTTNVTCIATDSLGGADTCFFDITVNPPVIGNIINQSGDTLCSTLSGASYQWNQNGSPISGATSSCFTATASGSYSVTVTSASGCVGESDSISFLVGIERLLTQSIQLFPNPSHGQLNLSIKDVDLGPLRVSILDYTGRQLKVWDHNGSPGILNLNLSEEASGIYFVRIESQTGAMVKKIVLQ